MKGFFLISTIFIMMGCSPKIQHHKSIKRSWMLVEFAEYSKEFLIKNKAELRLSNFLNDKNKDVVFLGCNTIFLKTKFKENGICQFSNIETTEKFCTDKMQLETEFIKQLPKMRNYKIEGHILTFSDGKDNRMKFVASDWD